MATFKCNDPIYTILRNGKVITTSARPATAVDAIIDDASRNVCPPDCCITGADIALDTFDLTVTSPTSAGMYIRVTITSGVDEYSTAWQLSTGSDTIDITGIIVEVGGWFDGDTVCIEYSYDQATAIESCCATVVTGNYNEDATYQLSEDVPACAVTAAASTFELLYQVPDGGVTISAAGEMVVPDIAEDETVFAVRKCDGCTQELLVLTAKNVVPQLALRLTFDDIANVPVASASSVSDWNTFFDLPAFGTPFTSVSVAGNEVSLIGGAGISMAVGLFAASTSILKVEDDAGALVSIKNSAFLNATAVTDIVSASVTNVGAPGGVGAFKGATALVNLDLPNATTWDNDVADGTCEGCTSLVTLNVPAATSLPNLFVFGCTSLTTLNAVLATTIGSNAANGCTSLTTFNTPLCADLGGTAGNDSVFAGITGNTITATVSAALQTIDGGNPDGDLVYLAANNTATIIYI